ncbi:MAG TPA: 4-hydroxy-tetrahydrodipicolinate reductase [Gammaproteobacteria bacterium]|nr:4-hydroxy-tetrahydrodipicolinate reductase [Gammaproteobacteria bacterium]
MSIPILINGAKGKMGKEIIKTFRQDDEFKVVGTTDREDDLAKAIASSKAKIVIDFTASSVGFQNASIIIQSGAHPVIGTTGFLPDQIDELKKRCQKQKLGGIIAPNFSIGAVLLMQFSKEAAKHFGHVEIMEMHHTTKEESPSGTSIRTADLIAEGRKEIHPLKKYREIVPHARGANHKEIPIHSVRLPGMVAHELVMFGGRGETLSLRHDSIHRECFMPGIKLACKKVMELKELIFGLEHIL